MSSIFCFALEMSTRLRKGQWHCCGVLEEMKVQVAPLATLFIAILMLFMFIYAITWWGYLKKKKSHSAEAVQYPWTLLLVLSAHHDHARLGFSVLWTLLVLLLENDVCGGAAVFSSRRLITNGFRDQAFIFCGCKMLARVISTVWN